LHRPVETAPKSRHSGDWATFPVGRSINNIKYDL
jgi:hypothetical protein